MSQCPIFATEFPYLQLCRFNGHFCGRYTASGPHTHMQLVSDSCGASESNCCVPLFDCSRRWIQTESAIINQAFSMQVWNLGKSITLLNKSPHSHCYCCSLAIHCFNGICAAVAFRPDNLLRTISNHAYLLAAAVGIWRTDCSGSAKQKVSHFWGSRVVRFRRLCCFFKIGFRERLLYLQLQITLVIPSSQKIALRCSLIYFISY